MLTQPRLTKEAQRRLDQWQNGQFDEATRREVHRVVLEEPETLPERFGTMLSFGTAGMRGLMGVGTSRINHYTVRAATQGLANYLKKCSPDRARVVIAYDSRHHSAEFAEEAAKVLIANDVEAYLFRELRPVPLLSFACRHLQTSAGIMITASHNPREYNGFKVYWSHGGQVLPPHDVGIIEEVNRIEHLDRIPLGDLTSPLFHWIGEEIDNAYLHATKKEESAPDQNQTQGDQLRVTYSSLHGTGIEIVPKALKQWGFSNVDIVAAQATPDGDFPTVHTPNPEEREALTIAITQLEKSEGDLLLATDPDCDRVGVGVRHQGTIHLLNGNQIACVALDWLLQARSQRKGLGPKPGVAKSIVTTELFRVIAEEYHCHCEELLTGFKYFGQLIEKWNASENGYNFLFGAEESYGCLLGQHARDKDAAITCQLICEAALDAKLHGKTLIDQLYALYQRHGVYLEKMHAMTFEGVEGKQQIRSAINSLRSHPPTSFAGQTVTVIEDFEIQQRHDLVSGMIGKTGLPKADVLLFRLEGGDTLIVRPSGTEPKIKLYCGARLPLEGSIVTTIEQCDHKVEKMLAALKKELGI